MAKREEAQSKADIRAAQQQRRTKIIEGVRNLLGKEIDFTVERTLQKAVDLAKEIVDARGIRKPRIHNQISAEDAGFYHDPFIIPENLVDYIDADRATIVASVLFSAIRPFGREAEIDPEMFAKIKNFTDNLDPEIYGDVLPIIKNTLQIRAVVRPTLRRKKLTVEDIRAKATPQQAKRNDYYRRMLMRMTTDKRAMAIRLTQQFAKLKNRQPITELYTEEEQQELLKELYHARHFYAPMAEKLGLRKLMEAIQDEILRLADPAMHQELHRSVSQYQRVILEKGSEIDDFCNDIKAQLEKQTGQSVTVEGRIKRPFAAWIKMASKRATIANFTSRVFDIVAIRLMTDVPRDPDMSSEKHSDKEHTKGIELFSALKKIRRDGKNVFEVQKLLSIKEAENDGTAVLVDFRDYMKNPKPNRYKAIHARLIYMLGKLSSAKASKHDGPTYIDVQIVTTAQNHVNETAANHADYKARGNSAKVSVAAQWGPCAQEVFVRTPLGEIHRLEANGATAVDFAEAVHTGLAAIAVGERRKRTDPFDNMTGKEFRFSEYVDENQQLRPDRPLEPLKDGDVVEIIKGHKDLGLSPIHRRIIDTLLKGKGARANMAAWRRRLDKLFMG